MTITAKSEANQTETTFSTRYFCHLFNTHFPSKINQNLRRSLCAELTVRSPEMFAPAKMPVAAGKKMANTEKKVSSSLKSGPMFSNRMEAEGEEKVTSGVKFHLVDLGAMSD